MRSFVSMMRSFFQVKKKFKTENEENISGTEKSSCCPQTRMQFRFLGFNPQETTSPRLVKNHGAL